MRRYAVPVHCAAALVIGRRAMGTGSGLQLKEFVGRIDETLTREDSLLPGEGRGMTWRGQGLLEAARREA